MIILENNWMEIVSVTNKEELLDKNQLISIFIFE